MKRGDFIRQAGGCFESDLTWKQLKSSDKKAHFWDFYSKTDHAYGIYSGASLSELINKNQYSIEHIIPKSVLLEALSQQAPRIRNGATLNPFNLAPSHRKINRIRGDAPFDFQGDPILRQIRVKMKSNHRDPVGFDGDGEWRPPRKSQGDLARSILYMSLIYSLKLDGFHVLETLIKWAIADAPSRVELKYNDWNEQRLGIRNPFTLKPELVYNDDLMLALQ